MVKVYDPNAKMRRTKNIITLTSMYGTIIGLIYYACIIVAIITIEGTGQLTNLLSLKIEQQIPLAIKTAQYYLKLSA